MSKRNNIILIAIIIGVVLLAAYILFDFLTDHEKKVGYVENNYGNTLSASFNYYDGSKIKTVKFEEGDNVKLNYSFNLEEGNLLLKVKDQAGNEILNKSDDFGEVTFIIDKTQKYTINVIAAKAKGNYVITWSK